MTVDGTAAAYTYNSRGQRVASTSANTEYLVGLSGERLATITPGTTTVLWNDYFIAGRHWGDLANGTTYFLYADWLGTLRRWDGLSSGQGCTSLPFGDLQSCSGGVIGNNGFASTIYNPESATNETDYRQQTPVQGRWLTPDPAGVAVMDGSNPQTWNRYAYVANNPLSFIDPLGLNLKAPGECQGGSGLCSWEGGGADPTTTDNGGGGSTFYTYAWVDPTTTQDANGNVYQQLGYWQVTGVFQASADSSSWWGMFGGSSSNAGHTVACFLKGAAIGAVGAAVVGGAAAGAVALGVVSAPVVTAALGVAAAAGGAWAIYNGIQQARTGNWGGVAFGVGSLAGGALVGGAGGRALAETINGVPSSPWSIGSDWAQGYRSNFPNGSIGGWWNKGMNPGSAGGSAAGAGAGIATATKKGC